MNATITRNANVFSLYESARFPATCASCLTTINAGAAMLYRKADGKAHHVACPIQASMIARIVAPVPASAVVAVTTATPDGFYTVIRSDGSHITFRIRTNDDDAAFAPGSRVIATLTGQDNESDYTGWGFVNGSAVKVWKSKANVIGDWATLATALLSGDWKTAGITYAKASGKCYICNRKLTTPESIDAGIGPICAGRI